MVLLGKRNRHALGRWIKHSMSSVLWSPHCSVAGLASRRGRDCVFHARRDSCAKISIVDNALTYSFLVCVSPMQKLVEADWAIAEQLTVQAVQGLCFFRERLSSLPLTQVYGCASHNCRSILRRLTRPG